MVNNMNLATIIVLIIIIAMVIPAILYIKKHGTCAGCPDAGACHGNCTRDLKSDHEYKEKSEMIDDIIKKHKAK